MPIRIRPVSWQSRCFYLPSSEAPANHSGAKEQEGCPGEDAAYPHGDGLSWDCVQNRLDFVVGEIPGLLKSAVGGESAASEVEGSKDEGAQLRHGVVSRETPDRSHGRGPPGNWVWTQRRT